MPTTVPVLTVKVGIPVARLSTSDAAVESDAGGRTRDFRTVERPADSLARHAPPAPGPVPDYAPLAGMMAHIGLRGLCQPFVNIMWETFGSNFSLNSMGYSGPGGMGGGSSDINMAWMRDYKPTYVTTPDGHSKVVTFASPNPSRHYFTGGTTVPGMSPSADVLLYRPPGQAMGGGQWLETQRVPLLHESGNLVSTGEYSFVTDKLFKDNLVAYPGNRTLEADGYRPRGEAEVRQIFCEALNIPADKLVVMPSMPGEKTGHQDMYLMALAPREVMIPQIPDEAIELLTMGHEITMGRTVQHFLEEQTRKLEGMGLKVNRLPMMAPTFLASDSASPTGYFGQFDSPANSLLINYKDKHRVVLPTVKLDGFPDNYRAVSEQYQQKWSEFFKARGYEPMLEDATEVAKGNGLWRCVTFPVPETQPAP